MALGWQPMELGEWREQMLFAQSPSLSLPEISAKLGGWGEGKMGEGWHLESWQAGWGGELGPPKLGSAGTGCRLSTLPSVSLLSPPPFSLSLSFSFSFNHSKMKRGRQGPHSTHPNLGTTPFFLPTTHHTIPPPSHLCSLSSWLGHLLSLAFTLMPKQVQFKYI